MLSDIYTAKWYRDRLGYRSTYHRFAETIIDVLNPASVVDVGCGSGFIVEHFLPGRQVMGVEGSRVAIESMKPALRRVVHLADLREEPLPQVADFDLTVSIEVAEHIDPEYEWRFLDWITRTRAILLTAAPPGQKGNHHVNCQPPEHWYSALAQRGYEHDAALSERWREGARARTRGCPWVVRNAMVFLRVG